MCTVADPSAGVPYMSEEAVRELCKRLPYVSETVIRHFLSKVRYLDGFMLLSISASQLQMVFTKALNQPYLKCVNKSHTWTLSGFHKVELEGEILKACGVCHRLGEPKGMSLPWKCLLGEFWWVLSYTTSRMQLLGGGPREEFKPRGVSPLLYGTLPISTWFKPHICLPFFTEWQC